MLSHGLKQYRREYPEEDEFEPIHLNYKSIKAIDNVPTQFAYIEQLYLNHNNLYTLSGIEAFINLKVFHFRFNNVVDFQELKKIKNAFFMESLAVLGNPMESHENCKAAWISKHLFRNLKEFNPSSVEYYRAFDKSYPLINNADETLGSKITGNQHYEIDASISFSANSRAAGTDKRNYNPKDISMMTKDPESNEHKMPSTQRFHHSFLGGTSSSSRGLSKTGRKIRPFEQDDTEDLSSVNQLSAETAKFAFRNKVRFNNERISHRFVEEQTEFYAEAHHCRTLA